MNIINVTQALSYVYGICTLIVLSCSFIDLAGNTTQTGNGTTQTVAGVFYEPDGTTPAPGARVTIHKLGAGKQINSGNALKKSVSGMGTVYTDAQGKFAFSSLQDKGPYMIDAEQGETLFAMIEYVAINRDDSVVNVSDTLKTPGSFKAVVCFDYADKRVEKVTFELTSYCFSNPEEQFPASFYFTSKNDTGWIDSAYNCNGVLNSNNLPEGLYTFRAWINFPMNQYEKKSNVYLKKPAIFIKSGQVTDLDTLRFPEMDVPDFELCGAGNDFEKGAVHIIWKWNAVDTDKVSGVNIYQHSLLKLPLKIAFIPLKDTIFVDTGFWDLPRRPEIVEFWLNPRDSTSDTYPHGGYTIPVESICPAYYLMAVDKNGKESWKVSSVSGSSFWWKKEDGIPFLPDTLPISWPDIF
jgi:hypothetical protein